MSDNDKHLLATLTGGFTIGILVAVTLRLQGVGGDEAFCGVALAGFCGGLVQVSAKSMVMNAPRATDGISRTLPLIALAR